MRVLGIDRAAGGWVSVVLADGVYAGAGYAPTLAALVAAGPDAAAIGVDMPIGLPDRGPRRADLTARAYVGARRASVFLAPPRTVLEARDHAEAVRRSRALTGRGVSMQAYRLRTTIFEAEALVAEGVPLAEVHPEASFRTLAGAPLAWGKKTWNGQLRRRALLAAAGIALPDDLGAAGAVPADDVLDAAAVAWTAHRIATGRAQTLPTDPAPGEPVIVC